MQLENVNPNDSQTTSEALKVLREAEGLLPALIENLPGGAVFVVDRNLRYLVAQGEALSAAGFKPEDFVGRTIFEMLPSELATHYERDYRRALAGEPFEREHNSHNRWYITRGTPLRSPNGDVYAVLVISFDITDRKQAEVAVRQSEERQSFLLKLSDALRSLADPVEIQEAVTQTAMNYFGADRCYYCEIQNGNAIILRDASREDLPSVVGVYPLSRFAILQTVVDAGRPFVVQDVHTTDTVDEDLRHLCIQLQVISYVNVPVIKNGKSIGVLCLVQSTPRDWTDFEVELATETAERTWAAVERARAEANLRESEEKYRSLFNSIDDGFCIIERVEGDLIDFRYIEVNPAFAVQTGISDVVGKTIREAFPGVLEVNPAFESLTGLRDVAGKNATQVNQQSNQNWLQTFDTVAQTGESTRFEHYIDSVDRWFEILVSRIDEDKHHIVVVFNNITDRKQAEADRIRLIQEQAARQQERQRAEALAELDRTKTIFFSNVSHEFRTPLTLLLAPLQDALSDRTYPLAPVHQERLELARRNSLRLLKLVNTLLDFSRIEAGRIDAVYEPIDLAMFTAELASMFRSAIERAGLRLIVDCPPLPELVYVDREMWEKIVLNLLSNAFKFTFTGQIAVRLFQGDRDRVIVQIKDTGTGIAPEHLPHLFERFYQIRGTQARTLEGSGIGLALVHELIRLHSGTIDVSSTVGQGTCFTIAIPFGREHLPSDRLRSDVGDPNKPTQTLTSTEIGTAAYVEEVERWVPVEDESIDFSVLSSRLNPQLPIPNSKLIPRNFYILIVDDNADMRDYLKRILSERYEAIAVADGAAALAAVQARVPDLVLSDVMMPGLDGFELLQALRTDPRTREVPIILLSARAGEEAIVEGLEAGADDYPIKPFSAQELVSRVNAHLHIAQLRGEALDRERTINRRKDELLSTVSHELNTPLVAILGWTRLLRANPPSPSMILTKALDTIERNATLQAKLIQDLLDISRITAGKLRLKLEPVALESVIEMAIAAVETAAIAKNITLRCFSERSETSTQREISGIGVLGDRDRLQQIFSNLLTNAVKFTPESGSIGVELAAIEVENQTYAEVRVTDTGIGIPGDFLPFVFDRFRQAENSASAKGLGLGLAIAQHLVELHKGTIYAQSAGVGQGATFIVRLPLLESFEL